MRSRYLPVVILAFCISSTSKCFAQCTASFNSTATSICSGNTVNFTSTSTGATGHSWKINEVPFSTSANSSYLFNSPGIFTVELVISDGMGCSDSLSTAITVNQTPVVNVSISSSSLYLSDSLYINFTATDVEPGAVFLWDFCDGNTSGNTAPFYYQWSAPGNAYCVCIELENQGGCTDADCEIGIVVSDDLGLTGTANQGGFSMYPNPAGHLVVIDLGEEIAGLVSILVSDQTGKIIRSYEMISGSQFFLDSEGLASGIYFVTIRRNDAASVLPLLIR